MVLRRLNFRDEYTPENSNSILTDFYDPALAVSIAYDRATFSFSAAGLKAAARGIAGLINNGGRIRIICDHQIGPETHAAIKEGRRQAAAVLRERVAPADLTTVSPDDIAGKQQLELLTWLLAQGRLDLRVAIVPQGIFHDKIGIITDAAGDYIAFHGSMNESSAALETNYESIDLFSSWDDRVQNRAAAKRHQFQTLWDDESNRATVIPVPDEYIDYLKSVAPHRNPILSADTESNSRGIYWDHIRNALSQDPQSTAATVPASLWPHQESFRRRHINHPRRVLIADEVGLGKTLQAGILLKTQVNQNQADRVLILTTKAARRQWQEELQDKFCIGIPFLDTAGPRRRLRYADREATPAPNPPWQEPRLIMTYHWLVRHAAEFIADELRYDTVIIDEAHHARFSEVNNSSKRQPNQFLKLLQTLAYRCDTLILLTATPMQTHTYDLWALIGLLEPALWSPELLEDLYATNHAISQERLAQLRQLYIQTEPRPQRHSDAESQALWMGAAAFAAAAADPVHRRRILAHMQAQGPVKRLMSRHTRDLLKQYQAQGAELKIPERIVKSVDITMSPQERSLYDSINRLVPLCYTNPRVNNTAMGFIMTTYRRRLGSSPSAYTETARSLLENRYSNASEAALDWDDLAAGDEPDSDEILPTLPLNAEQRKAIQESITQSEALRPGDTKYRHLLTELDALRQAEHRHIIIFTEFRDTQRYLIKRLQDNTQFGPINAVYGGQSPRERDEAISQIRQSAGLLVCTETAAESLNLQFCSAIINYDIPWNPMTLEQRIGRIDRIGQQRQTVAVINLFYNDTAEWDAYQAMDRRLQAIDHHVGAYRDILCSRLDEIIKAAPQEPQARQEFIEAEIAKINTEPTLDLDALNSLILHGDEPKPVLTMNDLRKCLENPVLLPPGWSATIAGNQYWAITKPDGTEHTVTTNRHNYDHDNGATHWWGPGSFAFPNEMVKPT